MVDSSTRSLDDNALSARHALSARVSPLPTSVIIPLKRKISRLRSKSPEISNLANLLVPPESSYLNVSSSFLPSGEHQLVSQRWEGAIPLEDAEAPPPSPPPLVDVLVPPSRDTPTDPVMLFTPLSQHPGLPQTPLLSPLSQLPSSPAVDSRTEIQPSPSPMISTHTLSPSPPLHNARLELPEDFIPPDNELPRRYALRERQARQINPYKHDKYIYKQQLRSNPDAIVSVVSPSRRRRGSPRRHGSAEDSGTDPEAEHPEDEDDDIDEDRFWRKHGSRTEHEGNASRAKGKSKSKSKEPDHGRSGPVTASGQVSPLGTMDTSFLRDIFHSDDDLEPLPGPSRITVPVQEGKGKKPKRRTRPFPLKDKELMELKTRFGDKLDSEENIRTRRPQGFSPSRSPDNFAGQDEVISISDGPADSRAPSPAPLHDYEWDAGIRSPILDIASEIDLPPTSSLPHSSRPGSAGDFNHSEDDIVRQGSSSDDEFNSSDERGMTEAQRKADRRRKKQLGRMMPQILVNKLLSKAADQQTGSHSVDLTEDDDNASAPFEQQIRDYNVVAKVLKPKDKKKMAKSHGLYTFASGNRPLNSGPTRPVAFSLEEEQELVQPTILQFVRKDSGPRRHHKSKSEGRLDLHPSKRRTSTSKDEDQVATPSLSASAEMGNYTLPSGILFGSKTYLGGGWLQDLLAVRREGSHLVRPNAVTALDFFIPSIPSVDEFIVLLNQVYDAVFLIARSGSTTLAFKDIQEWRRLLRCMCQHVSWFLASPADEGSIGTLSLSFTNQLRRASALVDEHFAVRADETPLNFLVFEIQWFAVELAFRAQAHPLAVGDYARPWHQISRLLRRLWAYGLQRSQNAINNRSPEGLDYFNPSLRISEIWICLIHLLQEGAADTLPASPFWKNLLDVIKDPATKTPHAVDLRASEQAWAGIFGLIALSQFSDRGVSSPTPRLPACWELVMDALERIRFETTAAQDVSRKALKARDRYIRLLFTRCMILRKTWGWQLSGSALVVHLFRRLLDVFKERHFSNLPTEASDFPNFLRSNNLQLLSQIAPKDTAFTLFLKLIVQAAQDTPQGARDSYISKILAITVPVGSVAFTKDKRPTKSDLSKLYNRFSVLAVVIHLLPLQENVEERISLARRYVKYNDADWETRRACIRGLQHLAILLKDLQLPLKSLLDWLAEMTDVLIDEYVNLSKHQLSSSLVQSREKEWCMVNIQLVLGCVSRIIKTEMSGLEHTRASQYPDPALLQGPWVVRVFAASTLTAVATTGDAIRNVVQAFLDARQVIVPVPPRPHLVAEEDSQQDYGEDDAFFDDPEVRAAMGENQSYVELREKETTVCDTMEKHIAPALFRLLCSKLDPPAANAVSFDDWCSSIDLWTECWTSSFILTLYQSWSSFLDHGFQSWERVSISNPARKRYIELCFMFRMLERDPTTYASHFGRISVTLIRDSQAYCNGHITLSNKVLSNATKNKIPSLTYRNKLRKVCLKVTVQHGILPGVLILKGVKTIDNVQRAAGGFADVFCGTYGEGKVGLKRLRVYLMSTDTQKTSLRKAFYRESILWKGLSHEAIVPFLGVTEDLFDGTICMVLPWYDNGCARAHLDRMKHKGDLSSDELLGAVDKWLYQTALGLEYLHDEGIVHGDVHAGNILIDDKENARITDFGMSLIAEGTAYNYASMHGGGALRWQAPELIDPEEFNLETSRPTTQSDVFSIACTAIELYSGRPPFPELADHQVSKRYIKGNRPPRPLLLGNGPGLMPHALWMIVKACWAQDRSQRPSARDVANRDGNDASLDVPQPLLASLTSRDAQIVLDEIWKVLDSPVLPNAVNGGIIFFEYRNKLRKLCLKVANNHSLLPAALILKDVRTIDSVQRAGGGNADVFCGTYHENRVALKRLRVYMMSTDTQKEKIRQAFYRESILWKGLVHEHIAPFLGVSEDVFGGLICMVLPWFDNGNVRSHLDKIRRGGVDSNKLLRSVDRWLHQTALGLEYLHHEGIVHGDLHPGNILIDDNENARITDFGMSLIAEATAYNYASIHGGGALRWKAPELVDPEEFDIETSRPTKKSDVFSIACTAIDLYSGNPPFPELADHQVSKRYVKGKRPPRPPLPGDGSGVMSSAMWAIVEACWAQDYTKRPSAHDIAARMAENRRSTSLPSNGPAESVRVSELYSYISAYLRCVS
ncbi:hypothetical protein EUX98_g1713 [Antrodiella citrinella]|uniref:Protein kinase domain-containing protein n=1 Tax=Antrodiella citrinella TaxID=2447956 RepID=A0A4S4N315_9APHY|nr:hypothetical protein EUX98_g1713 [Antrodiella citrinella]